MSLTFAPLTPGQEHVITALTSLGSVPATNYMLRSAHAVAEALPGTMAQGEAKLNELIEGQLIEFRVQQPINEKTVGTWRRVEPGDQRS